MKGKQLASLLGLVAVVGGVGYYLNKDSQKSWNGTGTSSGAKNGERLFPYVEVIGV